MTTDIPRGIEVLVKKASVDAEFEKLLLAKRSSAAEAIGLDLTPGEVAMLDTVPQVQLETIIARTVVEPKHRLASLGCAAAAMLLALSAVSGCDGRDARKEQTKGIQPDRPKRSRPKESEEKT